MALFALFSGLFLRASSLERKDDITYLQHLISQFHLSQKTIHKARNVLKVIEDNQQNFVIKRPEKFGGNLEFQKYKDLEKIYKEKKLHPLDLKNAVAELLISILEPVRKHFENEKLQKLIKKAYGD